MYVARGLGLAIARGEIRAQAQRDRQGQFFSSIAFLLFVILRPRKGLRRRGV